MLEALSTGQLLALIIFLIVCALIILVAMVIYVVRASEGKKKEQKGAKPEQVGEVAPSAEAETVEAQPSPPEISQQEERGEAFTGATRPYVIERADEAAELLRPRVSAVEGARVGGVREVMRVLRDVDSGRIIVEVEGRRYARLVDIKEGWVGRQVLWAIADLLRFSEAVAAPPPSRRESKLLQRLQAQPPTPEAQRPEDEPATAPSPPVDEETLWRELAVTTPPSPKKRSIGLIEFFRQGLRPAKKDYGPPRSFIEDINDILQRLIRDQAPHLLDRGLKMQAGPDGEVEIILSGRVYHSTDDVPDPFVRGLIRDAVQEWEDSIH